MNLSAAYGLLAHALVFGALAALLPLGTLRPRAALAATAVALLVGIAPFMLAVFGPPSLTLLLLALLQLAQRTPSPLSYRAALCLLACAIPLLLTALGWGPLDLHALGYRPWPAVAALLPLGLVLWWKRLDAWLIILALDLLAYAGGVFANLWDALLDPLLILLATAVAARQWMVRLLASRRR